MEWKGGSALLFWRWPKPSIVVARDGFKPYFFSHLPCNMSLPRNIKKEHQEKLSDKIQGCIVKGYMIPIKPSQVKNYIDYFAVPKGLTDIRVVYNGSSCGLNSSLFASNFWLPTSITVTRMLSYGYRVIDMDIGEMFLNFPLHESLQPYSAVDVTPFKQTLKSSIPNQYWNKARIAVTWNRLWMGMTSSPELSATYYYLAEEFIRGNPLDPDNPLRWDEIRLNLIGNQEYNPTFPSVYKWDRTKNRIAGDVVAYVDDLRAVGFSLEHAWQISRRVCSYLQYLGIQDAARKRRLDEGPWAGGIYATQNLQITKTVTIEKWEKGRKLIMELVDDLRKDKNVKIEFKRLERIRVFLCHLAMVFDILFPYLKGFHLTLSQHLPKRDEEGWKLSELEWIAHLESQVDSGFYTREQADSIRERTQGPLTQPPVLVTVVPRFHQCLQALAKFFSLKSPPIISVRSAKCFIAIYGFVDASGSGFGSTLLVKGQVHYRIGTWSSEEDVNSSNW